ncbi:MAG: transcriptional regulator [Flavobacteriaceae bacterium]|nr:transcriptional regulator [Flavobacteriaceae bacterium]
MIKDLLSIRPRSSTEILKHLEQQEAKIESTKTIARDIKILRELGYDIENPTKNRGYLLTNSDYKEDLLDRYNDYLNLSKLPKSKNEGGLITSPVLKGVELLPQLFKAVDEYYIIQFENHAFTSDTSLRQVCPLALKEYQGKWHLHTYDISIDKFRTFGVDRMAKLKLLDPFNPETIKNADKEIELFKRRLGSAKPMDGYFEDGIVKPQLIKVWVSSFYLNYLKTKKLHYSQEITTETKEIKNFATGKIMTYTKVVYVLVPNYDLIKVIVSGLGDILLDQPEMLKKYIKGKFEGLVQFCTDTIK